MHRIAGRLNWTKDAKTPGKTADQLEAWLPKDKWKSVNKMLVGFGQAVCRPIGPKCYDCGIKNLCPMKGKTLEPSQSKKKRALAKKADDGEADDDTAGVEDGKEATVK